MLAGYFDSADRRAVARARAQVEERLRATFQSFQWRVVQIDAVDTPLSAREEPTRLLDEGVAERDRRRWDFVLVITAADLVAHQKADTIATPSRALGVAVLSTCRIDPRFAGEDLPEEQRIETMARRVEQVALHVLGHLAGADHSEEATCVMHRSSRVEDLDHAHEYCASAREQMMSALEEVADVRLEEAAPRSPRRTTLFFLRALVLNLRPFVQAVRHMKPWLFPFRLSKLTTAAISTLLVLATTAEAWDVANANAGPVLAALPLVVLLGTSAYLIRRQRLVLGQVGQRTEQGVVTEASVWMAVAIGMATTFAMLFALTLLIGVFLYPDALVSGWVTQSGPASVVPLHVRLAILAASLGLLIGALGATFEAPSYLRHVAYVDEEV